MSGRTSVPAPGRTSFLRDSLGTLTFQVAGQQLSVRATHHPLASRGALRRTSPVGRGAAGDGSAGASRERSFAAKGRDAPCARRALRRRTTERRSLRAHVRRRGRGDVDRGPGIGPWTAHGFLRVARDRPDVFLPGDIALRRAIQRAYGFDHVPSEDEMMRLADRWRPYRSLAVSYLFASEYGSGLRDTAVTRSTVVDRHGGPVGRLTAALAP